MSVAERGPLPHVLLRTLVVLGALASWLVFPAGPAQAHSVSGAASTNFHTSMTGMTPTVAGIVLAPVENGSRIELTVAGHQTVIVKGYNDEPYLRVDPTGVWQNALSSATYLNRSRYGPQGLSSSGDDHAPPRWEMIHDGHSAVWHDHRTHWMSTQNPPVVQAAPRRFHQIYTWTIPLTVDGQPVTASGNLDWVPGPSPVPWFALEIAVAAAVVTLGLLRRGNFVLAMAVTTIVAADIVHSVLIAFSRADGRLSGFFFGNTVETVVWVLGLIAAVLLVRRSVVGLYLAATAGFVIAMIGGFGDVGVLYRSSAPIAGPIGLARTLTATTIGIGFGLLGAAAAASRQQRWRERREMLPAGPSMAG